MFVLLFFAFVSGLVTIFAPCIWPLLPIVLSSTTTGGKRKPLGITLGILLSFGVLTLTIAYIVKIIPFDPDILRLFAVVVIGFLGLTLIIPQLAQVLEGYVSRLSGKLARGTKTEDAGFKGGFITGLSLGVIWTPCAGPILATIATLAATRTVNLQIILVMIAYIVGVGIPLFIFASLGSYFFTKTRLLSKYTGRVQQIFGVIMILTAGLIFMNYDKVIQANLLNAFPSYSDFITKLEGNEAVTKQLNNIKGNENTAAIGDMPFPRAGALPIYGDAANFIGVSKWLNTDKPLSMKDLRGKVVLVDFWTYTCINCIRTLPYITSWYEKYKDKGFVVIGVHTPEFEFEKKTQNVENALKQYNITYPIAQDNDYATWNAYNNHYWPAKYLVDAQGRIRYYHFGEGEYETTEKAIQELIKEAGRTVKDDTVQITEETPRQQLTPETYLGFSRMDRFASEQSISLGKSEYTAAEIIQQDQVAYAGTWDVTSESAKSTRGGSITLHFYANKVFLVITPRTADDIITVELDGKQITNEQSGADVQDGKVILDKPRLYELVDFKDQATSTHYLRLQFSSDETEVFAFTFG